MSDAILSVRRVGAPPWPTPDPFLFCVHHLDHYPKGTAAMGPAPALLRGRSIGADFSNRDGWSMYHGDVVPGFPRHPHRGFETVTVVRRGRVDHSDSLGGTARYGGGDCQWMTAGSGIVHSEMFPLTRQDAPNTAELFQIWINLPARNKMCDPYFTMLWHEAIPQHRFTDDQGRNVEVVTMAGALGEEAPPAPPPESWASQEDAHVAIWTIKLDAGATWTLPGGAAGLNRWLYAFEGGTVSVGGQAVATPSAVDVRSDASVEISAGIEPAEFLMLQGRPIGEPVAKHGPFVMNTREELIQAYNDYQRTQFGGWPWPADDPAHPAEEGRFAKHPGGKVERRG
ncbi:MAG: pirin family protein [Deltaproteobacteria bacterium]|nr:pirin family protein [Deltaproteobacteria bacterium]